MSEHIIYDPDFDAPRGEMMISVFDAFSVKTAFLIGLATAFMTLAAVGFIVLLIILL